MNRSEWDPRFEQLPPSQPDGWADPEPLRFTDEGTLDEQPRPPIAPGVSTKIATPPTRPPQLVDDGYYVEPKPVRRRPYQGWDAGRPMPSWFAWWGLGVCVGIIVMALLITVQTAIDPAPRSAPVIPSAGTSEASAAPATPSDSGQGSIGAPGRNGARSLDRSRDGAPPPAVETSSPPAAPPSGEVGATLEIAGDATWYCNDDPRAAASPCRSSGARSGCPLPTSIPRIRPSIPTTRGCVSRSSTTSSTDEHDPR
jgi:hypothetical protein